MLTAYFDDSGTGEADPVVAVAGYIGSTMQWERFVPAWRRQLDAESVHQMHRTDLEGFHGEFTEANGWDPDRRTRFLQKLHPIIKQQTYCGVGSAMIKADFERALPKWVRDYFGGYYGWCAHDCIVKIRRWCVAARHEDPIKWVFEAGTKGSGQIQATFNELACRTPSWGRHYHIEVDGYSAMTKKVLPLQAADVIAYEIFKQTLNQIVNGGLRADGRILPVRRSLIDLMRPAEEPFFEFWNERRLQAWFAEWGERMREDYERTHGPVPVEAE